MYKSGKFEKKEIEPRWTDTTSSKSTISFVIPFFSSFFFNKRKISFSLLVFFNLSFFSFFLNFVIAFSFHHSLLPHHFFVSFCLKSFVDALYSYVSFFLYPFWFSHWILKLFPFSQTTLNICHKIKQKIRSLVFTN